MHVPIYALKCCRCLFIFEFLKRHTLLKQEQWPELSHGSDGIVAVATHPECDTVVTGIVGCAGLLPTVAAIKAGKDIALANKETLIAGGAVDVKFSFSHSLIISVLFTSTNLSFDPIYLRIYRRL